MGKVTRTTGKGTTGHDVFQARMKDQCFRIDQYRMSVLHNEGRLLSQDEAGLEWVERYAEDFARSNDD